MTNVIFNSGFIGFLIWVLLFAVSTAALQIAIRCVWVLRKSIFATAEFEEKLIPFLFLCTALMVSLLPLRVLPASPPTSCPEPAGQGERILVDADRDHSSCCLENSSSQSTEPFTSFCSVDRTMRNPVSGSVWVSPIPMSQ